VRSGGRARKNRLGDVGSVFFSVFPLKKAGETIAGKLLFGPLDGPQRKNLRDLAHPKNPVGVQIRILQESLKKGRES